MNPRLPLALALGLAGPASAQDLSAALEIWNVSVDAGGANDGNDEAKAVAIDAQGRYVLVGWQDGALDHGKDAFVRTVDALGAEVWTVVDDRGPLDVTKTYADDAYLDVEVDGSDQICLVGEVSGDAALGWESGYYIAKLSDVDGVATWTDTWQDGGASVRQGGLGLDLDLSGDVVTTGWSYRHPNQAGQWATFRYITTTGLRDLGPLYHNVTNDPFATDGGTAVAVDASDNIVVVGTIGQAGSTGPDDADVDWHIRKYDTAGVLLWEATWAGAAGLADVPTAVVTDSANEVTVVGYTNKGTDNGAGADWDWQLVRFDQNGAAGYGNQIWETSWEHPTAPGAREQLFDAHIAENQADIVVAGTWDDGGQAAWKVSVVSWQAGAEISTWEWPAVAGGDSTVRGIDVRDDRVAVVGSVWNGTNLDIQVAVLDQDTDADTVGDSIDGCPFDPAKTEPGLCGCGNADVDTDADTFLDCDDACPNLADKWLDEGICGCDEADVDRDGDATPDCIDNCADDPLKTMLGVCGCGVPDDDSDGDGILGCDDACSQTPAGTPVDDAGCPAEICDDNIDNNNDTRVDCDDSACAAEPQCATAGDGDGDEEKGCGCSVGATGAPSASLAFLALALLRRRR